MSGKAPAAAPKVNVPPAQNAASLAHPCENWVEAVVGAPNIQTLEILRETLEQCLDQLLLVRERELQFAAQQQQMMMQQQMMQQRMAGMPQAGAAPQQFQFNPAMFAKQNLEDVEDDMLFDLSSEDDFYL